ncbi:hypothetical protein FVE85_6561 [Porphyridium purpureum]|uniref:Large ribosomal subunit protein uL30-like ferredoxin-like fold domain-containing protein n=1 Tax=Porphyridium purpureum TaxID=35688 RepID=A0A5J4Z5M2_PORPP|nr:hypothetical protein FVE85_6561 [Porphyridium purpureum]|eukprot:POR0534..scf295_1
MAMNRSGGPIFRNPELRDTYLLITMTRGTARKTPIVRDLCARLLLRRPNTSRIHPDGPVVWGMVRKMMHMVELHRIPKEDLHLYSDKERLPLTLRKKKRFRIAEKQEKKESKEAAEAKALALYNERMRSLGLVDAVRDSARLPFWSPYPKPSAC